MALAVAGLGVSMYLTASHLSQGRIPLACATGGLVDCERVTTSAASMVGPVPIAALGVLWFLVTLLLSVDSARPSKNAQTRARLAWSVAGLAGVFYLVYVELFVAGAICLWCTVVHALIVGIFLLSVDGLEDAPKEGTV
jgi:uncharacterized membrane protein